MRYPILLAASLIINGFATAGLPLQSGDRVALVGNTFIEREADAGHVETALTLAHPGLSLSFRNFGWSGDTVDGASRGYFKPQEGYGLLLDDVAKIEPTVILLNYGANAAWQGDAGADAFRQGLNKLVTDLKQRTKARFILASPIAQEAFPKPYPNPTEHNRQLAKYAKIVAEVAAQHNATYLDFFTAVRAPAGEFWTSNSLHLTADGYREAAKRIVPLFGKPVPNLANADQLRQTIIAKNEQFFNQWRPQNTTYLFGFRKHEQGNNAVEMTQIDPFLKRYDDRIRQLAVAAAAGRELEPVTIAKPGVGFKPMGHKLVGDPESQRQQFRLPDDLEVSLFAAEPMVTNPTCMNWDQHGRLWVACAPLYPHVKPGHRATDQIVVLEDLDGDGKADKSTVFADGLLIPTAVLPGDGGVYVGNSTEIIHLKDTDGDGRADSKRIVLSGFGTEDTHHILHTPRWGQDGLMYFNQSIYIHSHVETPRGVQRLMAGGVWQFDPRTEKLAVIGRGLINSWGHQMDDYGQSFLTDGAGGEGINYLFPGVAARTAYGTRHILRGLNPGQPKLCGLEIISGTHFPDKYRGLLLANDFRGHRTNSFRLTDNGSGYVSTQDVDFIGTDHRGTDRLGKGGGFRPVDLKMGPDGALYVADWSNIIIQHGEVDFRDDRRDHENGRIWRITAKDRPLLKRPKITTADVAELTANLASPERWIVEASKRELIERGPAVLPEVVKWQQGLTGPTAERLSLHALWLHLAIGSVNDGLLRQQLVAKDGRVRAAAVRVLRHWQGKIADELPLLRQLATDAHPRVRLEALHALRALNSTAAAEAAVQVLDHEMDTFLDYALVLTLRDLQPQWVGKTDFGGNLKHLAFGIQATGDVKALKPLVDAFESDQLPAANRTAVFDLIARLGNNDQVGKLLTLAVSDKLPLAERTQLLNSISEGVTKRKLKPNANTAPVANLIADDNAKLAAAAIRLSGLLGLKNAGPALQQVAMATGNPNAAAAIKALGTTRATAALTALVAEAPDPARSIAALATIADYDPAAAARLAVAAFNKLPKTTNPAPAFDAWYRQKTGPTHLNNVLKPNSIPAFVAEIGVRQATTCGRDLAEHVRILSAAGGLKPMQQQLTPAEMQAMVARVAEGGDPVIGERIYRRDSLACMVCHAIGGAGPAIGPDMVSIGASAPIDYLIESLLDPNAKIKEGYHMTVATLKNGQSIAGGQISDSANELVIRDPAGVVHTIAKKDVASKVVSPTSMMPSGLTASLQPEEFVHLVAFLSKLGNHPDFTAPDARTLRTFEVVTEIPADVMKMNGRDRYHVSATGDKASWGTEISLVNGDIPLDASIFPRMFKFVRFTVNAPADGPVVLHTNVNGRFNGWRNGERLDVRNGRVELQLTKGNHQFVFDFGSAKQPAATIKIVDPKNARTIASFAQ